MRYEKELQGEVESLECQGARMTNHYYMGPV